MLAGTIVLIALLELGGRLSIGAPRGIFSGFLPGAGGLYPPNAVIQMIWGPVPYRVTTNSLGFRGPEVPLGRSSGVPRIAAIGDSVTDGVFADDDATYPHLLKQDLADRGIGAEVINAARGGGSIDKELAILDQAVLPLEPEIVLLTFVTNDISELRGRSREQLVHTRLARGRVPASLWLITHTAVGEIAYDLYLRVVSEPYRRRREADVTGARRYEIAGGTSLDRNVRIFRERYAGTDGIVLGERFSPETETLIGNYLFELDRFLARCTEHRIQPGLVYFPAYPEVYGPVRSARMRDTLARAAADRDLPFLDLTPVFRREDRSRVLYLAPVDFHPNPDGNAVMASAIADFVADTLLPRIRH